VKLKGNAMPLAVAITLSIMLIMCGVFEYFKLTIITTGIRDAVQSAVISSVVENYDETYRGLREGYSGGYQMSDSGWQEQVQYSDIYKRLDSLLGLKQEGDFYVKYISGALWEYRLHDLDTKITNAPLAPSSSGKELLITSIIKVDIPVTFANKTLPPLKLNLHIKAAYTPKF